MQKRTAMNWRRPVPRIAVMFTVVVMLTICCIMADDEDYVWDSDVRPTSAARSYEDFQPASSDGFVRVDRPMENLTKFTGENVRLRCEISGSPVPRYTWFKDNVTIQESRHSRLNAKDTFWGSRLRINSVQESDSGVYSCEATNVFGRERASGMLLVKPGRPPNYTPRTVEVDPFPSGPPDEETPIRPPGFDPFGTAAFPNFNYRPPGTRDSQPGNGFCQPYRGVSCSRFVANKSIYVLDNFMQGRVENQLLAAITVIEQTTEMSERCEEYAIPLLCHFNFPLCDNSGVEPQPRQICQEECNILMTDMCKTEYVLAKTQPVIGNSLLPRCEDLPAKGTPQAANCVSIGLPKGQVKVDTGSRGHTCYNGTGMSYQGTVSHTKSGLKCQKWTSNSPHLVTLSLGQFPLLQGGHNYCRNPGGRKEAPWCFTMDKMVPTELCDIPKCPDLVKTINQVTSDASKNNSNLKEILIIVLPSVAIPLILALIITVICLCSRQRRNRQTPPEAAKSPEQPNQDMEMTALIIKNPVKAKEFPRSAIRFVQELGEGAFGKVYKAEVIGLYGDNTVGTIAVKTLKENASQKIASDFRREVELMSDMRHLNIVCLIGVCMKDQPWCMLFEYMPHGDLHEFLIRHSPHSDVGMNEDGLVPRHLDTSDMLYISVQIAAGMEFLCSHHFVHRDLAARNVLVGDNLTVKISDFGLSRDVYSSDYYRLQSKALLPVRWMAPESILYGKFTVESDVWSYGVLLWEIFSYGLQPYYGYTNQEVIEMIRGRQILPCPDGCPSRVYTLMVECWHEMPARRPTFNEIHMRLRQWRGELIATQFPQHNLAQSHSGHSSSTQHSSGRSQQSHHSSTGPSNNTTTTGLTGSSGRMTGGNQPPPGFPPIPPPPVGYYSTPYSNVPSQGYAQTGQAPPPPGFVHHPAMYKKPSPPGSVASHKSSSHSSRSSSSNYKPNMQNKVPTNQQHNVQSPVHVNNSINARNEMIKDSMFITEPRQSEI
ncbi:inactive tyrosine-protein kinase transmembrane receptor ROR1 [Lingula anatina]|uniref:Tyrosine-protein kinase receptor n=1 Tax=Lingula anatina TaxID=7574 RepID=A0A1S3H5K6_LINAN|nr:inactive tyrosine-protein kinase transmembrane receptor ROR1 [Lingula anatina]|eukprot:XP_013380746.1 inactive tyrosine-protein kinase transmembrane receptor ROR1 [Lingula anatina]